jgi:hypothetical protein
MSVAASIVALVVAAILLLAARQPGGIPRWLGAKLTNSP